MKTLKHALAVLLVGTCASFAAPAAPNGVPGEIAVLQNQVARLQSQVERLQGQVGQKADPPCFSVNGVPDNVNRYIDCGNGTVTDTVTGLIWLKQAGCLGTALWAEANMAAAALKSGDCDGELTDHSIAGDWRLPTTAEWEATVAQARALGCIDANAPSLTNTLGRACYTSGLQPFTGVQSARYWSSSAYADSPESAWLVRLDDGSSSNVGNKISGFAVWPVRGGR